MKIAKTITANNGVNVPISIPIPKRIITNPKYIGFRVMRKIPVVINMFDSKIGFTVVSFTLNDLSADKFRTIPGIIKISPKRVKGKWIKWIKGKKT